MKKLLAKFRAWAKGEPVPTTDHGILNPDDYPLHPAAKEMIVDTALQAAGEPPRKRTALAGIADMHARLHRLDRHKRGLLQPEASDDLIDDVNRELKEATDRPTRRIPGPTPRIELKS